MNCMMLQNDTLGHCWPVPNYVKYHVTEYGFVRGEEAMMTEIMARGYGEMLCDVTLFLFL